MHTLAVAVATILTLIALFEQHHAARIQRFAESTLNRSFDPFPHPMFPEVDCDKFLGLLQHERCPDQPENIDDQTQDNRVCAEIRIWYSSHCIMHSEHCTLEAEGYNLVGMCHKPKNHARTYERKWPYTVCNDSLKVDTYCPRNVQNQHICGVYMKSYKTLCEMELDWCENIRVRNFRELAKILQPKKHHEHMEKHHYYDKCNMYSPVIPRHREKYTSKANFEKLNKEKMQYDRVCNNTEIQEYNMKGGTKKSIKSFKFRKYYDTTRETKTSGDNCVMPTTKDE